MLICASVAVTSLLVTCALPLPSIASSSGYVPAGTPRSAPIVSTPRANTLALSWAMCERPDEARAPARDRVDRNEGSLETPAVAAQAAGHELDLVELQADTAAKARPQSRGDLVAIDRGGAAVAGRRVDGNRDIGDAGLVGERDQRR